MTSFQMSYSFSSSLFGGGHEKGITYAVQHPVRVIYSSLSSLQIQISNVNTGDCTCEFVHMSSTAMGSLSTGLWRLLRYGLLLKVQSHSMLANTLRVHYLFDSSGSKQSQLVRISAWRLAINIPVKVP